MRRPVTFNHLVGHCKNVRGTVRKSGPGAQLAFGARRCATEGVHMKVLLSALTFLTLLLAISCSSAMPGQNNNGNNQGGGPTGPTGSSSVVISSLSPTGVSPGAQDFTLTIVGKGFPLSPTDRTDHPGVLWSSTANPKGTWLVTDLSQCDATHVTARVPANLVLTAGTFDIQVQIYHFADDTPKAVSNVVQFVVGAPWDY